MLSDMDVDPMGELSGSMTLTSEPHQSGSSSSPPTHPTGLNDTGLLLLGLEALTETTCQIMHQQALLNFSAQKLTKELKALVESMTKLQEWVKSAGPAPDESS